MCSSVITEIAQCRRDTFRRDETTALREAMEECMNFTLNLGHLEVLAIELWSDLNFSSTIELKTQSTEKKLGILHKTACIASHQVGSTKRVNSLRNIYSVI